MGLMMSVLVFSVGILEAISCIDHIRASYVPLEFKRRKRRMVMDVNTRTVRFTDVSSSGSSTSVLRRSSATDFEEIESKTSQLSNSNALYETDEDEEIRKIFSDSQISSLTLDEPLETDLDVETLPTGSLHTFQGNERNSVVYSKTNGFSKCHNVPDDYNQVEIIESTKLFLPVNNSNGIDHEIRQHNLFISPSDDIDTKDLNDDKMMESFHRLSPSETSTSSATSQCSEIMKVVLNVPVTPRTSFSSETQDPSGQTVEGRESKTDDASCSVTRQIINVSPRPLESDDGNVVTLEETIPSRDHLLEEVSDCSPSSPDKAFWLIFSGEYTKAMSKDWHSGHFCCWQCDESLTGQRYVLRDDHPYCIKCYESVFANTCDECNKTIGIDSKDLSYKDKHWHEACFFCNKCRVSLVDKQFGSKADKIYCGNCYDAQFASRCDGCSQIFRAGTKKMEYKTRQWHEQCFCCCVCKTPIGTKSFIPREQEIYCATCYEEKFATRCVKCNKIITSGGVTYKNEPWHRECFTCTNCNTSLAGQRFTSRDEKPYCADCFGELFAKRCTACCKPITGIGGTRFISFEDRHWHNDCFICASCKTSLVGRGFITDAEDILCTECAKQKLM